MLCKATTTSVKDFGPLQPGIILGPPAHEMDTLTTEPLWRLQISGDVVYWIIMVVWKPFNPFLNDKF